MLSLCGGYPLRCLHETFLVDNRLHDDSGMRCTKVLISHWAALQCSQIILSDVAGSSTAIVTNFRLNRSVKAFAVHTAESLSCTQVIGKLSIGQ